MKTFTESFSENCLRIRETSPLIHNITNYVAMTPTANALLAIGASPIMSSEKEEMLELASRSDALVVNLGCLELSQMDAMDVAAQSMMEQGKPWVLDPVGAGATSLRTGKALELAELFHPDVIRANAAEVMALYGVPGLSRGVDSPEDSAKALESAVGLARRYSAVVSVSGPVDYITDGSTVISIGNGSPMMTRVTAMGCSASAITAAFLAVDADSLRAAACAMALMGVAGERAARQSPGPGSLSVNFLDNLAVLTPSEVAETLKFETREYVQ